MKAPRPWPVSLLDDLRRLRRDLVALEHQESARNRIHFIAVHQRNHPGLITALRERG
ncbi:MAG: hypothetical protein VKO26_08585 [Cyanobacteriota bacterium]|nr:hypothetical protein [Cyanobacteriota bacterium]